MYCKNCGTDVGDSRFCPNCGSDMLGNSEGSEIKVENFNLITAYISMFKKYAKFSGRSRRSEYWLAWLANYIISLILCLPLYVPVMSDAVKYGDVTENSLPIIGVAWLLLIIYGLATFIPSLAMSVRRLHDTGRSGWSILLGLIPFVGGIIVFVFTVLDSQPGANKYGSNPKGM